jgi:hypothetical protein
LGVGLRESRSGGVPDGVAGSEADPLGDGAVLLLRFGKLLLGAEGLVALRGISMARGRVWRAECGVPAS